MPLNSMQDLFVEQISDLYDAEQQLVKALPKMASAASDQKLRSAFEMHLDQTREHVQRLDQVFSEINMKPKSMHCEAMEGLIKEGDHVISEKGSPAVKDAALIAAAQRVEHYEIAGYGTVRTYADELGFTTARDLLQQTLDEEGQTNKKLNDLATGGIIATGINEEAAQRS